MHKPPLVDTHCHLDLADFDSDRVSVLERARDAGVPVMLTVGTELASSERALALAQTHAAVYAAVGLHPNDASAYHEGLWSRLEQLAATPRVIAWGEIGLDYHRDVTPVALQQKVLRDQLALARDLHLPVVVHIRKAHQDTLRILAEAAFQEVRGVLHCWSGDLETARRAVDLGYRIGVGGPLTYRKSTLPAVVAALPWEALLVETDAPYLAPEPRRGRRNEPAWVRHTFDRLVATKDDLDPDEAARRLWDNFRRTFPRCDAISQTAGSA